MTIGIKLSANACAKATVDSSLFASQLMIRHVPTNMPKNIAQTPIKLIEYTEIHARSPSAGSISWMKFSNETQ